MFSKASGDCQNMYQYWQRSFLFKSFYFPPASAKAAPRKRIPRYIPGTDCYTVVNVGICGLNKGCECLEFKFDMEEGLSNDYLLKASPTRKTPVSMVCGPSYEVAANG